MTDARGSTWKGRQCRVVRDGDPVAVRVAGGWFVFEIDGRGRPLVSSVSDNDLGPIGGRPGYLGGKQLEIEERNQE
jgi:hypothetical protein